MFASVWIFGCEVRNFAPSYLLKKWLRYGPACPIVRGKFSNFFRFCFFDCKIMYRTNTNVFFSLNFIKKIMKKINAFKKVRSRLLFQVKIELCKTKTDNCINILSCRRIMRLFISKNSNSLAALLITCKMLKIFFENRYSVLVHVNVGNLKGNSHFLGQRGWWGLFPYQIGDLFF